MDYPISTIVGQFNVAGTLASVTQIPNGHINDTFVVALNEQKKQKGLPPSTDQPLCLSKCSRVDE